MSPHPAFSRQLTLDVLQQFRLIYGTMRQYFNEVEGRCGLSGSQMWILQEVQRTPNLGITELAGRLGIHQSTCSQLVEKLVAQGCLTKKRAHQDKRRIGLCIAPEGFRAIAVLPGPAEGVLAAALAAIPEVALNTLNINLYELIVHLSGKNDAFASTPLAGMVQAPAQETRNAP